MASSMQMGMSVGAESLGHRQRPGVRKSMAIRPFQHGIMASFRGMHERFQAVFRVLLWVDRNTSPRKRS